MGPRQKMVLALRSSHYLGSWRWCLLCASQAFTSVAHLGLSVSNVPDTSISLAAALRHEEALLELRKAYLIFHVQPGTRFAP